MKFLNSRATVVLCIWIYSWIVRLTGNYDHFESLIIGHNYILFALGFVVLRDIIDIRNKLENLKTDYMMVDMKLVKAAEEEARDEN